MSKKYTVRCKSLLPSGEGLINFNHSDFSVKGVLPKEKCNIELIYKKDRTDARVTDILEPSPDRVQVKCPVYDKCGGCNLLHMSYDAELKFKEDKIKELYKDFDVTVLPIIKSPVPEHYRNKVYASFGFKKINGKIRQIAGMYEENTREVVNSADCLIQNKTANDIIKTIVAIMNETGTRSYDPKTKTGTIRHVYIRVSKESGKVMLVIVTGEPEFKLKNVFVKKLTEKYPCIETIVHNINTKNTGMILGERNIVLFGKGYITDEIMKCKFNISPKSFYQVNPVQTEKLYETALRFAGLSGVESVIDAYSGIGTISIAAAKHAKKVFGVELNRDAINDAIENAKLNGSTNVEFINSDAGEFLKNNELKINPDLIFMDPPRSGSDEKFLSAVCTAAPKKIVYISCNPETQVRDVKYLTENGYELKKIQPVDMFSRVGHVEACALLVKASGSDA